MDAKPKTNKEIASHLISIGWSQYRVIDCKGMPVITLTNSKIATKESKILRAIYPLLTLLPDEEYLLLTWGACVDSVYVVLLSLYGRNPLFPDEDSP